MGAHTGPALHLGRLLLMPIRARCRCHPHLGRFVSYPNHHGHSCTLNRQTYILGDMVSDHIRRQYWYSNIVAHINHVLKGVILSLVDSCVWTSNPTGQQHLGCQGARVDEICRQMGRHVEPRSLQNCWVGDRDGHRSPNQKNCVILYNEYPYTLQ